MDLLVGAGQTADLLGPPPGYARQSIDRAVGSINHEPYRFALLPRWDVATRSQSSSGQGRYCRLDRFGRHSLNAIRIKAHRSAAAAQGGRPPAFDAQTRKDRNVVERVINRLKDFRAVATRYYKRGYHFLAGLLVAAIVIWPL